MESLLLIPKISPAKLGKRKYLDCTISAKIETVKSRCLHVSLLPGRGSWIFWFILYFFFFGKRTVLLLAYKSFMF